MRAERAAPSAPAGTKGGRQRARGLTRSGIIDVCLQLVDEEGDGALTFRRIGRALGADPTALYRHFRDKDELMLALADRLIAEALLDFTPSDHWRDTVRELITRGRRAYLAHPQIAILASVRVTRQEAEMTFIETMLATLRGAGLGDADAVRVYRACADFMLAWTGFSAGMTSLGEQSARDDAAWAAEYAAASPEQFPNAVAFATEMAAVDDEVNFAFALELLLDGVAARIPATVED